MNCPLVSFIVPCYKLGHLLSECVTSILSQTYSHFEVLIMDDCSPDNTSEVARSLSDPHIRYVRNDQNLGHLANYNRGIGLSQGKYVWLISADDRLRRPYVLARYVRLLEEHPNVGYVCCPGISLQGGLETTLAGCGYYGPRDKIFNGRQFIAESLHNGYGLLAPSVMVRKDCYDKISTFPLDMPHQGDWYLWFRWALDYDVAYISEPMVNYRDHDMNIMKTLQRRGDTVFRDEVAVLWRTKRHCEEKGFRALADKCEDSLATKYAHAVAFIVYGDKRVAWGLSTAECVEALRSNAVDLQEYERLRGKFYSAMGDEHWWHLAFRDARRSYLRAIREHWRAPKLWLKFLHASIGPAGIFLRDARVWLRKGHFRIVSRGRDLVGSLGSTRSPRTIIKGIEPR